MRHLTELDLPRGVQAMSFATAEQMARHQAERVAAALRAAIEVRDEALLVVSGGRSPQAFFQALSEQALAWHKVTVSLTDERWVAPDRPESNARLVHDYLLQGLAVDARWQGLYHAEPSVELAAEKADALVDAWPAIDALTLGMGADGHIASLFPGNELLPMALAEDCPYQVLPMRAPEPPHERLSLTLPAFNSARNVWLAIQGEAKLEVLIRALREGDPLQTPVAAVLNAPLQILWAP